MSNDIDKVLRNAKVHGLHRWLDRNFAAYDGLYEAGSVAVGDPWVEGRSDREIVIVLGRTVTRAIRERIQEQLPKCDFDDTYLFNLRARKGFLRTRVHHDIAMKFRGQVLFGKDLLIQKDTPPREFAAGFARNRLRMRRARLNIRMLNARCWSVEHLRDHLYPELKLMFLSLADKKYAETGEYPKCRLDVAECYRSEELRQLAESIEQIDLRNRDDLIMTALSAVDVLDGLRGAGVGSSL